MDQFEIAQLKHGQHAAVGTDFLKEMEMVLRPSKEIWDYYKGKITADLVVTAITDRWGGYHISYSTMELLKDLKLVTRSGMPNKKARDVISTYQHEKYYRNIDSVFIEEPE